LNCGIVMRVISPRADAQVSLTPRSLGCYGHRAA
jgi:hypothetical protein